MWLVESADAEPQTWRANCKVTYGFSTVQRVIAPNPSVVPGSTIIRRSHCIASLSIGILLKVKLSDLKVLSLMGCATEE